MESVVYLKTLINGENIKMIVIIKGIEREKNKTEDGFYFPMKSKEY